MSMRDLILQGQFSESISFSFNNAKDYISTKSGIKSTPQQTHWEFYELVKDMPEIAHEFKELTGLYETAMYSNSKIGKDDALKALDLLKEIYKSSSNE
ncbi:Uncharacterised protein [uncultured archaeon]|nr:Uncharacterised protein [uncultured archaeon]